ncbi:hypothetical protein CN172_20575 [Sinorhizobium meliloti]|nr:hypothetical protein CN232_23965 [Sinorhizobium meliloti]RVH47499.1 hypothetical protein CN208_04795 [Sinorhizobium meliloti]RVK11132.1 hypothetical protein CN172_20575 [Sinorhizobium meliloti]
MPRAHEECKGDDGEDGRIHFAFDRDIQTIAISAIVPLKSLPEGARESRKFALERDAFRRNRKGDSFFCANQIHHSGR